MKEYKIKEKTIMQLIYCFHVIFIMFFFTVVIALSLNSGFVEIGILGFYIFLGIPFYISLKKLVDD